jgi:hypothetical protein
LIVISCIFLYYPLLLLPERREWDPDTLFASCS